MFSMRKVEMQQPRAATDAVRTFVMSVVVASLARSVRRATSRSILLVPKGSTSECLKGSDLETASTVDSHSEIADESPLDSDGEVNVENWRGVGGLIFDALRSCADDSDSESLLDVAENAVAQHITVESEERILVENWAAVGGRIRQVLSHANSDEEDAAFARSLDEASMKKWASVGGRISQVFASEDSDDDVEDTAFARSLEEVSVKNWATVGGRISQVFAGGDSDDDDDAEDAAFARFLEETSVKNWSAVQGRISQVVASEDSEIEDDARCLHGAAPKKLFAISEAEDSEDEVKLDVIAWQTVGSRLHAVLAEANDELDS